MLSEMLLICTFRCLQHTKVQSKCLPEPFELCLSSWYTCLATADVNEHVASQVSIDPTLGNISQHCCGSHALPAPPENR